MPASLFGIIHSSRNFADPAAWGKNQFNSAFPVALMSYLRSNEIPVPYICHTNSSSTELKEISMDEVFGTTLQQDKLYFDFEARFDPYRNYVHDEVEKIDLVVKEFGTGRFLRPLEIKLTTLPDDGTSERDEEGYGAEIVIRSATMRYLAIGMAHSCLNDKEEVRAIFEPSCGKIRHWESIPEMTSARLKITNALELFLNRFADRQKPLLVQPVWKTIGKTATLADNCLDVFVWSDFAVARLFMDTAKKGKYENLIPRPHRAALRLARFLYEWSVGGRVYQQPIYDAMSYDKQTDKEFAVSGRKTNRYMTCARLTRPIVTKQEIKKIVLGGGQHYLSPERRFDAILYFSKDLFDE